MPLVDFVWNLDEIIEYQGEKYYEGTAKDPDTGKIVVIRVEATCLEMLINQEKIN